jgi:hypothetical protein
MRQGLSGLAGVGNFLDLATGASSVRDIVSGENPFDQFLTPFSAENRVGGREMLERFGALGRNRPGFDWGDVAGFGAEVFFDPATYATLGGSAVTKLAGTAMKNAGLMRAVTATGRGMGYGKAMGRVMLTPRQVIQTPSELKHFSRAARQLGPEGATKAGRRAMLDDPIGGLAGLHVPFGRNVAVARGSGAQLLARGMDWAGETMRATWPVRQGARLFASSVRDMSTLPIQRAASKLTGEIAGTRVQNRALVGRAIADLVEQGRVGSKDADQLRNIFEGLEAAPPEMGQMVNDVWGRLEGVRQELDYAGLRSGILDDDMVRYFPRFMTEMMYGLRRAVSGKGKKGFQTFDPTEMGRQPFLKNVEGGTVRIKQILQDPQVAAAARWQDVQTVIQSPRFRGSLPAHLEEDFSKWAHGLSENVRESGVFGNHPLVDLLAKLEMSGGAARSGKAILEMLTDTDVLGYTSRNANTKTIGNILQNANMAHGSQGVQDAAKRLGMSADDFLSRSVNADIADDIGRMMKFYQSPDGVNEVLQVVDSVTNLWKGYVTGIAPAFHTRNLFSGQVANAMHGMFSANSVRAAHAILRGRSFAGLEAIPAVRWRLMKESRALTPGNAADMIRRMAFEHELVHGQGEVASVAGQAVEQGATGLQEMAQKMPGGLGGAHPIGGMRILRKATGLEPGTTFNPLEMRGFGGRPESRFTLGAAGDEIGVYVEGMNRLAPFIQQLKRGVRPGEAADRVKAVQIDYSARKYTQFEREKAQRLFPFWKFSKNVLPPTLKLLFERPGGLMAQTLRATRHLRGEDNQILPEYISQQAAIPLGTTPQGDQRFLSGFGFMHEDPIAFAGTPKTVGLELLSRANPLIKGPLEFATGQTFFQRGPMGGRRLEDLDPTIGRIISNAKQIISGEKAERGRARPFISTGFEQLVSNLPTARITTSLRTATDTRKNAIEKVMNLFTGVRLTTLSPAAQDAVIRETAQMLMREYGANVFEKVYFSDDEKAAMTPDKLQIAEGLEAVVKQLRNNAKLRKDSNPLDAAARRR